MPKKNLRSELVRYKFEILKQEMSVVQKGKDIYNRTSNNMKAVTMAMFTAFIAFSSNLDQRPSFIIFVAVAIIVMLSFFARLMIVKSSFVVILSIVPVIFTVVSSSRLFALLMSISDMSVVISMIISEKIPIVPVMIAIFSKVLSFMKENI